MNYFSCFSCFSWTKSFWGVFLQYFHRLSRLPATPQFSDTFKPFWFK